MTQFSWHILKQKVNAWYPMEDHIIRSIVDRNQIGKPMNKRFKLYCDEDVARIVDIAKKKAEIV